MVVVLYGCVFIISFAQICAADIDADFKLTIQEDAINEILQYFAYDINDLVVGAKVAGMSGNGITTSDSEFQNFSYSQLVTRFDGVNKAVHLQMLHVNGSIAKIDITLRQKVVLTTVKCKGEAHPVFRNWRFSFSADVFINNTCDLAVVINENSVIITEGDLELNEMWYNSVCDTLINALDAVLNIKQRLIDDLVQDLPGLIVDMLQEELLKLLPSAQNINLENYGGDQKLLICYQAIEYSQEESTLEVGIDFLVENSSLSEEEIDRSAVEAVLASVRVSDSNLAEIWILFAFGVLASFVGCGCMLAICVVTGRTTLRNATDENEMTQSRSSMNNLSVSPSVEAVEKPADSKESISGEIGVV